MDISDESDNICTPPPPKWIASREGSSEHEENAENSPPPKRPAARGKKAASNKTQKSKSKSKSTTTSKSKSKHSSGKPAKRKRLKASLGLAYVSPPSSPVLDLPDEQLSPPHTLNHSSESLELQCDPNTYSRSSILGTAVLHHSHTTCVSSYGSPPSEHPDISDLFLDPQSPPQPQHASASMERHRDNRQELHRNGGVDAAGLIPSDSLSTQREELRGQGNETQNSALKVEGHLPSHSDCEKHNASVSIDDLFG